MKIGVVLGSNRPGRVSERIAKWVVAAGQQQDGLDVELIDLASYELPLFDEVAPPRFNQSRKINEAGRQWTEKVAEFDGYVVISPEYNGNMPAALKNAIDYIGWEIDRKPIALVTHGSTGGARSAETIAAAISQLGAARVPEAIKLISAASLIDEDGKLSAEAAAQPYGPQAALDNLWQAMAWWTKVLKAGREDKVLVAAE